MVVSIDTHPFRGLVSSLSIADRAALGLSDNDVRTWSAAKADEYRTFALALLSISNALAPIHRLPAEILSQIFGECWTDRKSLRVGHVCRQWRSVLLTTSRFWADAATGHLAALLERSVPRMVAPTFYGFPAHLSPRLAPHAGRFVSLVVVLRDHSEFFALWTCLDSGMHSLETLTIALVDGDSWIRAPQTRDRNPTLSPTAVPRLTQITTPGRLMHRLSVPSLQHITLRTSEGQYSYYDRPESYETLRRTLEICAASLETLVLLDVAPSRTYDGAPLPLPALRRLRLRDSAHRCARTLALLVLPDTTRINCTNTDNARLCDAVPLDTPAIQSSLRATDHVAIVSTPEATVVRCCAGTRADSEYAELVLSLLSIGLAGPRAQRHVLRADDLVSLLRPTAPVTRLALGRLGAWDAQGVDFRAFPHLVRVGTVGGAEMAALVLRSLARLDDDDGQLQPEAPARAVCVCPGLKELMVDFEFDLREGERGLGSAVREGRWSVVEADFRERCAQLERVLSRRAEMGARVARLEFQCMEKKKGRAAPSNSGGGTEPCIPCLLVWTLQTRISNALAPWGAILEPLERLVGGPEALVVGGYRICPAPGWQASPTVNWICLLLGLAFWMLTPSENPSHFQPFAVNLGNWNLLSPISGVGQVYFGIEAVYLVVFWTTLYNNLTRLVPLLPALDASYVEK